MPTDPLNKTVLETKNDLEDAWVDLGEKEALHALKMLELARDELLAYLHHSNALDQLKTRHEQTSTWLNPFSWSLKLAFRSSDVSIQKREAATRAIEDINKIMDTFHTRTSVIHEMPNHAHFIAYMRDELAYGDLLKALDLLIGEEHQANRNSWLPWKWRPTGHLYAKSEILREHFRYLKIMANMKTSELPREIRARLHPSYNQYDEQKIDPPAESISENIQEDALKNAERAMSQSMFIPMYHNQAQQVAQANMSQSYHFAAYPPAIPEAMPTAPESTDESEDTFLNQIEGEPQQRNLCIEY